MKRESGVRHADEQGRIYLGKKVAKRFGKVFAVLPMEKEIHLIPLSNFLKNKDLRKVKSLN
ncbi:MAG: hypothetical protein ACREBF_02040 [Candidatus Micrarchaeales archaeon]